MNSKKFAVVSIPTLLISIFVFLFGALALIVPSGYVIGPVLLLLFGIVYLFVRPYPLMIVQDKYLIAALIFYFAVSASTNMFHHLSSSSYDNCSRFLLAIPVLLLLLRFPVRPVFFWMGISLGAIGSGLLAAWLYFFQDEARASGHTNAIQFGDIAILFSCVLLAGIAWARTQSKIIFILLLLGSVGGFAASLLSGARGGWLAFPVALIVLYILGGYRGVTKNNMLYAALFFVLLLGFCYLPLSDFLQERVNNVFLEWQSYQQNHDAHSSVGARLHMWQTSITMIAERPLAGWGTLSNYLNAHDIQDDVLTQFNHVHNDFLDAIVKRGICGGLALAGIYIIPAILFYRRINVVVASQKSMAVAGFIVVMATVIFGLTQTFFSHSSGVMVYSFLLVIIWAQVRHAQA